MPVVEVENGATDEAHPEIFDTRAMLPQRKDKKPGQISDDLIRKYFEDVSSVRKISNYVFRCICISMICL